MMKKRKFQYSGYCAHGGGAARAVVEGGMGARRGRGRPQGNWRRGGVELSRMAKDRGGWKRTVYDWVSPRPSRLRRKQW